MFVYILTACTGAHSSGVFPNLEAAQSAFLEEAQKMEPTFVPVWKDTFGNGMQFQQTAPSLLAEWAFIEKHTLGQMCWA